MAFDKHTADLAKYYRSVGQSPANARRLAKANSSTYVAPRKADKAFGEMAYRGLATEGWDTEELLAAEADPMWVAEARAWATEEGKPFPPAAVGRDFAGSIIAAMFGL